MKNLLVVIDMVNGFVNQGALADKNINKITPTIEELICKAKNLNTPIVAFKDCHTQNDPEFKVFPKHCIRGTIESELIPELKKYENDMKIIEKDTTNGFITKEFLSVVKKYEFNNVYVTGCCTDICVLGFVESYLKFIKQNNLKTKIFVYADACYTFDGQNHNAKIEHQKAIERMQREGAVIAYNSKSANLEK